MIDNVALMRSLLFPYDVDVTVKDIEKGLTIFANKHKITRYVTGTNGAGKQLIQIVNWWKYQKSTQWAGRSQFIAPPKWKDRVRAHEMGGGITLLNWDSAGGYEAATKPLRSGKVEPAKPLRSREDEVKDEVNNNNEKTVIVVVADAIEKYGKEICKVTDHTKKELEKLYKTSPKNMVKALDITIDQDKHTLAYFKGVFNNLQKGTVKPEAPARRAQPQPKKLDTSRYVKL
jgi:hypothetical protein